MHTTWSIPDKSLCCQMWHCTRLLIRPWQPLQLVYCLWSLQVCTNPGVPFGGVVGTEGVSPSPSPSTSEIPSSSRVGALDSSWQAKRRRKQTEWGRQICGLPSFGLSSDPRTKWFLCVLYIYWKWYVMDKVWEQEKVDCQCINTQVEYHGLK